MKHLLAAWLGLAALLAPFGARAASLDVSPVRIELSARQPSALLTVKNQGGAALRVQLKGHAWQESATGEMLLAEAPELSVFPALFQLGPGEERKVRVGTAAAPGATERSWRVFIEELPSAISVQQSAVRVLTRVSVPVFLAPLRPDLSGEVRIARADGGLDVSLSNTGTVHLDPASLTFALLDAGGTRLELKELKPWYVLPGGTRTFRVTPEVALCAKVRRAEATVAVGTRKVEAALPLPTGACAR